MYVIATRFASYILCTIIEEKVFIPRWYMTRKIEKNILEIEDIASLERDEKSLQILSREQAQKIETIVFSREKNMLHIITTNTHTTALHTFLDQLREKHFSYELYFTSPWGIDTALNRYNNIEQKVKSKAQEDDKKMRVQWRNAIQMIRELTNKKSTLTTADFIMELVRLSFQAWSSDLHFQPEEDHISMKLRIDWVLQEICTFDHKEFYPYGKKIKFIAGTKMNVEYIPQDGRFWMEAMDRKWHMCKIDVRASFMPGINSESIVLRFLDSWSSIKNFNDLWFRDKNLTILQESLMHNHWLILITWPTWSGKTTTLYSILHSKNSWKEKIITLEDPIEYKLAGIQQSQINYRKWYDYLTWLKACMRHDPDIILVWETRILETAETVVNAALTWHLVFTTLHTNSAIEAITRLSSMWIKPYMLWPSLIMIVAQRLIRTVCPHCSKKVKASIWQEEELQKVIEDIKNIDPNIVINYTWYIQEAVWCDKCNGLWYSWRVAVMEVLRINDAIKDIIIAWWTSKDIEKIASHHQFLTIKHDCYRRVIAWETTLDELRRVA